MTFVNCDEDTILYGDGGNGIVLSTGVCCATKKLDCVIAEFITTPEEVREHNFSMVDENGDYLESQGMFRLNWNTECGPCKDSAYKWLMTKEDVDQLGWWFYQYDSATKIWKSHPRNIELDTINGRVYYVKYLLCAEFGGPFNNKDRKRCTSSSKHKRNEEIRDVYTKVKVPRGWDIQAISGSNRNSFYYYAYEPTEIRDRKRIWFLPYCIPDTVEMVSKQTGVLLRLPVKPVKTGLFKHRLYLPNPNASEKMGYKIFNKKWFYCSQFRERIVTRKDIKKALN